MKQEQQTLAERYAEALFELCVERDQLEQVGEQIKQFAQLMEACEELNYVFTNPVFPLEQRQAVVKTVAEKGNYLPNTLNFLLLLLEKKRAGLLPQIQESYQNSLDRRLNRRHVQVITAQDVSSDLLDKIGSKLQEQTNHDSIIEKKVDSSLLGGVVVKIGDRMLDGSIRSQLNQMKEHMLRNL